MSASFIDMVKNKMVRHPTQMGFKLSEWEDTYKQSGDRSNEAQKLYDAGKWVFDKLENARVKLATYDLLQYDKDKSLCMLVADLNRIIKVLSNLTDSEWDTSFGNIVFASQMIQWKFNNAVGPPLTADSILSISIDGARYPIVHISLKGGKHPFINSEDDNKIINRVRVSIFLGQYYDAIENLWLEFLWHGWEIADKKDYCLIIPIQDRLAENRAISDYRRESLMIEATHHIINVWKHLSPGMSKEWLFPHIDIQGSKNRKRYLVRYTNCDDDFPPLSFIHQIYSSEEYYDGIMDSILPKLSNISLGLVMKGWEILYALCKTFESRLPKDIDIFKVQTLLQFAPKITRGNLINLFQSALKISQDQANRLLDFFIFIPSPRNELWDAPLITLSGEEYTLVMAAVLHGNLLRIMERFMIRGDLNLSKKGKEFEIFCRQRIKERILQNDLFKTAGVYPNNIKLDITTIEKEEIDILLWIGNTFIVAEAKCLIFPSGPLDFRHYYDDIENGARQAQRKALFADRHKKELISHIGLNNDANNIHFKPLVIVNSPFGAGFTCSDVPVTDLHILGAFLRQRCVENYVIFNPEGKKEFVGSKTELYTSEEGAAESIYDYLCKPPQIAIFKKYLKVDFNPTPKISDDDKPFAVGRYEVKIPLPQIKTGQINQTKTKR